MSRRYTWVFSKLVVARFLELDPNLGMISSFSRLRNARGGASGTLDRRHNGWLCGSQDNVVLSLIVVRVFSTSGEN